MKKIFSLVILVFIAIPTFALYTIKGKIVDSTTQDPIDFANVALYKQDSNVPATGVTTDATGNFSLPQVSSGKYTIKVSFVGYNTLEIPLNVSGKELNMGVIKLVENSKTLNEVQVLGQGTQMRFEVDKKVFSVDQNIAAAGGAATEVLQNIPSVSVDNEGNVSLRNNANVEIWINGKPSGLNADNRAQILQQMPAESIQSIEVMTNPSAKFNPEGTAGIINIVLKKNRKAGYFGSASAGAMYTDGGKLGTNLGFNINYNSNKINAYTNIGYRRMNFTGGSETNRYSLSGTDTTSVLDQSSNSSRSFGGLFLRAGIDYQLNDKNTFSLNGFGMLGGGNSTSTTTNLLTNSENNSVLRNYKREITESGSRPSMNISADYKHEFDKNGSNLTASLSYSHHKRGGDDTYTQIDYLNNDAENLNITQTSWGENTEFEFKTDYTKKFEAGSKIEAGWESTAQNRQSPASAVDHLNNNADVPAYFNNFNYNEQIHAGYFTYGNKFFDKLSVQGGLRGEYMIRSSDYTYKDANDNWSEKTQPVHYDPTFRLFPSAFISYSLPKNNELQLNYTSRVNRPRGRQINPFRDYSDSTNITYGNATLNPEYASSLELNYLKSWNAHSISTSAYYRYTDNVIEDISFIHNGTMESTYLNLAKSTNAGMEIVAKDRLFKILNLTTSLNFYYNKLDSTRYDDPYNSSISTLIPEQKNFSWSGRVMANIILGKNTSGQVTADYSAPTLIAQGKQSSSYAIDLGLRQTFMDRKLSLSLMVRDLLNSRKTNTTTWGDGFYQESKSYFHGRMIGLTASYSFGNTKAKNDKKKTDNNQSDMMMDDE